ncbi:MAG: hypothetical protein GX030_09665 [Firmicutes bacterium]|nr:hypothetical protein [Bacillota bacterium]
MRPIVVGLCVVMMLAFGALAVTGASAMALIEEFVVEDISGKAYAVADLTHDGVPELIVGSNNSVYIMQWDGSGFVDRWQIPGIAAGVASLTVGDVDADGLPDLLVGTGQAGSIIIFGFDGQDFFRKGETDYLWSAVDSILVSDVDGNGWEDILAVTSSGGARLLQWNGLGFDSVWRLEGTGGRVSLLTVADVNDDGVDEVIYGLSAGKVAVLQWLDDELVPIWENYPWGTVSAVTLMDVDRDGVLDIVITTKQEMLYAYGWNGSTFELKHHLSDPLLKISEAVAGDLDGDGQDELISVVDGGLRVMQITRASIQVIADVDFIPGASELRLGSGRLILFDAAGALHSLRPVPKDFFELVVAEESMELAQPPIWVEGQPLLSATDVTKILGPMVFWDAASNGITIIGNQGFVLGQVGSNKMTVNGEELGLTVAPVVDDDVVYLPLEMIAEFATALRWQPQLRRVELIP